MASTDVWADFEQVRHSIRHNTVDKLKQIVVGINDECGLHISKTGRKQEIIERIYSQLDSWRTGGVETQWARAKPVIVQVRQNGSYSRAGLNPSMVPAPTVQTGAAYAMPTIVKSPYSAIVGSNSINRYDPYAPPRKPVPSSTAMPSSSSSKPTGIKFKESPFFRIDQHVSSVMECPESTSSTDRKQQALSFTLNNDHLTKLKAPGSKYQLRLFCTSSVFYAGANAFRSNPSPCPIEFPPTCEVRINNVQLTANLKGLKKKPGTAPPPDIGQYARFTTVANRIDMVYVNSQQPPQPKKYYLVVMLVEATTVERLVVDLKASKYRTSAEIRRQMIDSLNEDDDIVAGPQKMSLKCPLVFIRINTPCRSAKCVHSQCFDANSWFSVMEQTTSWLCPVCERVLDTKDLIIDGYFDEILKATPESVEDVIVESNGDWHTADNEHGSAAWMAGLTSTSTAKLEPVPAPSVSQLQFNTAESSDHAEIPPDSQILVLDSDEEDEGRVKRELSPYASGSSVAGSVPQTQFSQTQGGGVIDLTLDSDDDEPPPPPRVNGKRKAPENDYSAGDQAWKKTRVEPEPSRNSLPNGGTTNYHQPPPSGSLPNAPVRYPHSGYQTTPSQSEFPPYPNRNSSQLPTTRLPGINAILPQQGRWA